MKRLRRHRIVAAIIGCLALGANLLALMSTCVHRTEPASAAIVDAVLGPLTICSAEGAVVGNDSGGQDHSKAGHHHCQACTLLAGAILLAAAALVALAPLVVPLSPLRPAATRFAAVLLGPGGIRSRAPPLPA